MKTIKLTQNQIALVDDEDYEYLSQWKWCAVHDRHTKTYYAARTVYFDDGKHTMLLMHRYLLSASKGQLVDHINHNTTDNRRENLRLCSNSQNVHNREKLKNNTSGYKGVIEYKPGKYRVQIRVNGTRFHVGCFQDKEEAAKAYDAVALEMCGEFANLNFPVAHG